MNTQYKHIHTFIRSSIALLISVFSINLLITQGNTQALTQAETYCKMYAESAANNACKDGWNGKDCSDYLQNFGQTYVDVCQSAAKKSQTAKPGDDVTPPTDKPGNTATTPPATNNTSNSGGNDTLQQLIDQVRKQQGLPTGDAKNKPLKLDNNRDFYVNGNNEAQSIKVLKQGTGKSPVIVFINGGGWHLNDGVGQKISPKAIDRGYATIEATYRLGSSGINYMYEDVMLAMKHVRDYAKLYGIDPSRIVIWGDSAGGSLAMRAAASGQSGAAAAVGWSAPTNAYTAIFRSVQSFAIGMDHSTCVPTDLNGLANALDVLQGGEGNRKDTGDLTNNGGDLYTGTLNGGNSPLNAISQVLTAAQLAQGIGAGASAVGGQAGAATDQGAASGTDTGSGGADLQQNVRRLATKKVIQCIDNFKAASPALYASPLTPPTFLAGFTNDSLVGPDQAYQMRDKLRTLGIKSSVMMLPGRPGPSKGGANHLDYNEKFVKPSLDFVDSVVHPKKK